MTAALRSWCFTPFPTLPCDCSDFALASAFSPWRKYLSEPKVLTLLWCHQQLQFSSCKNLLMHYETICVMFCFINNQFLQTYISSVWQTLCSMVMNTSLCPNITFKHQKINKKKILWGYNFMFNRWGSVQPGALWLWWTQNSTGVNLPSTLPPPVTMFSRKDQTVF